MNTVRKVQKLKKAHSIMGKFTLGAVYIVAALAVLFVSSATPAFAQFDTGTIVGSVTDPTGAVIPRADVVIANTGTGIDTNATTDASGSFVVSALPFGRYVVSATATGFGKTSSQPLVLNVGATVSVKLALAVATTSQSVEVTGTTATVDTSTSTAGTTLNSEQIGNLPVNGRDVSDFLEISPGSVGSTSYFQGSVNGLDNIFTGLNIKLDGQSASRGDVNGFLETEGQEGARITRASVDSIQEIDFANSGYSAQSGFSLGPQMNIITKGGTNDFHGTAYEFFRNQALDARDYFAPGQKVPLHLNQFGGNLGGRIIPKKLFFFVNYEGDRTHITTPEPHYEVISAYVRSKFDSSMQPILAMMAPLPSGCGLGSTTATCSYDVNYPDVNDPSQYDLVFTPTNFTDTVREDTGSVRFDYHLGDKDTLMFRYNINDSLTNHTYGNAQGQLSPQGLRTQLAKVDETHIFSPSLLNEFSVAVNRFYSNTASNTGQPYFSISSFFVNLGALPGAISFNQTNANTLPEMFDNLTKTIGNHTLNVGAQIRLNRLNTWLRPIEAYDYYSFESLETNQPFVLQKNGTPGFIGNANSNWDVYGQDDWRVTRNLTFNIGLRYDYNTTWNVAHGNQRQFDYATQTFGPTGASAYSAPRTDFAPRVGFAWQPYRDGKTVVHGYAGLFYMPMQPSPNTLASNMPANASISDNLFDALFSDPPFSISYPQPNPPLLPGEQNVYIFPTDPHDPYSTNWLFGVEQEIAPQTVLTINYTGNKVQHTQAGVAFQAINLNPQSPNTNVPRPLSLKGVPYQNEYYLPNSLFSNYNAMQVQVRRNTQKLQFEANYTWSHEIDDEVNVFAGFENPYDPTFDRGNGDWDTRQNFTASALYNLPELKGSSKLMQETLGGWQASTILQTRSGLGQNVEVTNGFFGNYMRPNVVKGAPVKLTGASWPTASYNINAFALEPNFNGVWGDPSTLGTVGRNSLRGPAFFQLDMSGMKNFAVTENVKVQFRADIFNIFNHPNFSNVDTGICSSVTYLSATSASCTQNKRTYNSNTGWSGFGTSSATIADANGSQIGNGTARQAQLSLKVIF
ncbi:MAG TPA: carboxypeptidase regulatory-like domain-containing protein [Terracidiphilus sp.]|nr:carboxypeptidase regulatory-like domain-containing protein [Terracidiphilus sp.]